MDTHEISQVVCPEGYTFIKPHLKNGKLVVGYCRKTEKQKRKDLAKETVEAIPFGFDAVVGYDYLKYGNQNVKKIKHKRRKRK